MLMDPSPAVNGRTDIGGATLNLIRDLVLQFHATEPDVSKSVLVFLPTYRSLEKQWLLLNNTGPSFRLFVLHSSIDIEHSVKAMEIACRKRRKVILATNVAESSVTIPGVSYVIDSCRSLEIFWDRNTQQHAPRLVWISQSQADQRKGRTGRTCDGTVVRLVTRHVYHGFSKCETPQMQLFSLRKQVLMITSAESKSINDPILLLQKCMNPPALITVTDALEFLEELRLVVASPDKGRHAYHPTKYGELLLSMPLSLESAIFVVRGGTAGYVRESAVLGAIMDSTPSPILQPFSQPSQYRANLDGYYKDANSENGVSPSRTSVLLANLCAFEFWQRTLKDKHRIGTLEDRIKDARGKHENQFKIEWGALEEEEAEEDWCIRHNLSLSGLRVVAETADILMEKMHQYRPEFICGTFNLPSYYIAENASHNCIRTSTVSGPKVKFLSGDDSGDDLENDVHITCADWPFVESGTYRSTVAEKGIGALITEVRGGQSLGSATEQEENRNGTISNTTSNIPPQCRYFIQGLCTRGSSCPFSHSISAKPMPCRFYQTYSGCRYGNECRFSHDGVKGAEMLLSQEPVQFQEIMPSAQAFIDLIPSHVENRSGRFEALVILLGEGNFTFAEGLAEKINPARIVATSVDRKDDAFNNMPGLQSRVHELMRLNVQVRWGVDAANLVVHGNSRNALKNSLLELTFPWDSIGCLIWNFPFQGTDDDLEGYKLLMRDFFASVAVAFLKNEAEEVLVLLTLYNDQFGRWQVERAARESFLFLQQSIPFETYAFGAYRPMRNKSKSSFEVQKSSTYVFKLCWPSNKLLRTRLKAALAT